MDAGDIFEGKYRIVDILGKGGMGTVYLARNIKLDTPWAIKEINKRKNEKVDVLVEPNILKRLNHPALPRIFDVLENEECIYIIADYIEGVSLDKELNKGVLYDERQVAEWSIQICDVLSYLHGLSPNPIIYRDMKPSNIIISGEGNIKLIDFGIAREYKTGENCDTVYIGTVGYAAPEQYGTGQTGPASDIYSLGVTMYHMLTGKHPGKISFNAEAMKHDGAVSDDMADIIDRCTKFNPLERFQTAIELSDELSRLKETYDTFDAHKNKQRTEPKQISFRRLVLNILNNSEFACELAYAAARMTNYKVLLLNLDILSARTNFYMGLDKVYDIEDKYDVLKINELTKALDKARLNFEDFQRFSIKLNDCISLYALTAMPKTDNYNKIKKINLDKLLNEAYKIFDLTIIVTGSDLFDPFIRTALDMSDYNIISSWANMDMLLEYKSILDNLNDEFNLPTDKVRLIAWEYKTGINLPESLLKQTFGGGCYAGKIKYSEIREKSRNYSRPYTKTAWKKQSEEYKKILGHFNIIPKATALELFKEKLTRIISKTGWRKSLNE